MKKTIVYAFAFASIGLFSTIAKAQSVESNSIQQPQVTAQPQQEVSKQPIAADALPDAVKQILKSDALKEWQVSEVYKVAPDAEVAEATYEVHFTNAEQKKAIARFDAEGKVMAGRK
ncbi:hypothetical protein ACSX1A_16050 [Pontibacter sp. MBLB2868]|uniref:hypothetical protein n=1 Tax=Pontibacter sp. MBLB2868 TaxID=3451555 RepID=UPI003F74E9D0